MIGAVLAEGRTIGDVLHEWGGWLFVLALLLIFALEDKWSNRK